MPAPPRAPQAPAWEVRSGALPFCDVAIPGPQPFSGVVAANSGVAPGQLRPPPSGKREGELRRASFVIKSLFQNRISLFLRELPGQRIHKQV